MTDQRKDDLPDNGGTPEERPGGKRPRRHWGRAVLRGIGVLLVLAVVMSLVVVSTMSNGRYKDRFRRWLIYGSSEEENLYSYSADSNNLFAQLGDYLVLANQNHLQLLRSDGTAQQDISVQLSHPALSTGGGLAAAWDVGGTALTVADEDGVLFQRDQEEKLISVRLNQAGWLAVTEEKSGYKGTVTVYNQEQEKVFAFNSSSRFLLDAVVSRDGRRLLAVTMSQEGGAFVSNLVLYDLSQTEPLTEGKVQEGLVLDLWDSDDGYRAVCDDMLAFADKNAQLTGTYSYGAFYLQDYSMSCGTFTALLLLNFIIISIAGKQREIGILRAVGARGLDVFKIFFAESGVLVGSCLVFSLFGTAIAAAVLNHILKEQLGLAVSVFLVGPLSVLLMAAVAAVVALLGTFFPVFFAARKKPVDTIRSL